LNLPISRRRASRLSQTHTFFSLGIALCCAAIVGLVGTIAFAQATSSAKHFFPMTQGTYWVYQGTVTWFDQAKRKPVEVKVSLKMSVERVFHKDDTVFAEIQGYPANLNFTTGEANPSRWILTESSRHQIFLRELDPGTRLPASETPGIAFDSFMTEDDLLFEWPLARGKKYCDAESAKREDEMYCWIVDSESTKNLETVLGLPSGSAPVFTITYRTNPDDTQIELSPGIGIIAYRYHHHGTTAETDVKLIEFHPVPDKSASGGGTQ
jgi:hypothetical protein